MKKISIIQSLLFLLLGMSNTSMGQTSLTIGSVSGTSPGSVSVPVTAVSIADMQGFQFTIDYDNSKLSYVNCSDWAGGTNANGVQINDFSAQGKLTFVYNDVSVNLNSGTFFKLNFQILQGATGQADLAWSDSPTLRELSNSVPEVIASTYVDGSVTISAETAIASNTISQAETICEGEAPSMLTGSAPSGGNGVSYQFEWISSTSSVGTGYASASGTVDQQDYSSQALSTTTWFKRVVESGSQADTSNAVEITVNLNPTEPTITLNGIDLESSYPSGNQWYLDGSPINGATEQTYTALANGDYTVEYTDGNGCSSTSAIFNLTSVGITETSNGEFSVLPNPSNGLFTLSMPMGNYSLEVFSSDGQLVHTGSMRGASNHSIDLSNAAKGVYTLRLSNAEQIYSQRIILQ